MVTLITNLETLPMPDNIGDDAFAKRLSEMAEAAQAVQNNSEKTKYELNPVTRLQNFLVPLLECTSCKRWWAGVAVGYSTGVSLAHSIWHFIGAIMAWALFFIWAEYAYKNGAGGDDFAKAMAGMDLFQSTDTIIGAKESESAYLLMLLLAVFLSLGSIPLLTIVFLLVVAYLVPDNKL